MSKLTLTKINKCLDQLNAIRTLDNVLARLSQSYEQMFLQ